MTGTLARMYAQIDDNATALELALSWRDQAGRLKGTSSVEYGDAQSLMGSVYTNMRDMDLALASFKLARQAYSGHSDIRKKEQLRVETSIGFVLDDIHRYAEAAEILEAVMPRIVSELGAGSWEAVDNRSNLAFTYMKLGNSTRALALDQENEQYFGGLPEFTRSAVTGLYENMAANQLDVWHLEQARKLEEKAYAGTRQLLGADANEAIRVEHQLGYIVAADGNIPEAIRILDDARERAHRIIRPDNLLGAQLESLRIRPYLLAGRLDDAAGSIRTLLDNKSPEVRKNIFLVHSGYGLVLLGRADEAASFLEQRIEQLKAAGKNQGIPFGHLVHTLAGVRLAQGRLGEADDLGAQAERAFASDPLNIGIYAGLAQLTRSLALSRAGDTSRSEILVTQAEKLVAETVPRSHPLTLYVQLVRAELMRAEGQRKEADILEREARRRLFAEHGITLPVPTPYAL